MRGAKELRKYMFSSWPITSTVVHSSTMGQEVSHGPFPSKRIDDGGVFSKWPVLMAWGGPGGVTHVGESA